MGKPQNACPDVPLIAKNRLLALESCLFQAKKLYNETVELTKPFDTSFIGDRIILAIA